jgi:hypothetical protein
MRGTLASGQIINADGKNDRKFAPELLFLDSFNRRFDL